MTILEGVRKIDSAFPIFSYNDEGHIWATLDEMPFDPEGMQRRRNWHNNLYQNIMEFLEEFPELEQIDRQIICDLRMNPIREHVLQTKSKFDCYCESLDGLNEILDRLNAPPTQSEC
jgi:hypothetical protein